MKVDKMPDLLIGTSGYDYPEWKGVFYPDDLKRKDFLSYYATQFNALELNNTFYNTLTFYNGFLKQEMGCFYVEEIEIKNILRNRDIIPLKTHNCGIIFYLL